MSTSFYGNAGGNGTGSSDGVLKIEINELGELVVYYTNGEIKNLGPVQSEGISWHEMG